MYINLLGRDGIVASVSLDQSYRGAMFQLERAYLQYHLRGSSCRRTQLPAIAGVNVSQFYRRCRQLGVPVS